MKKSGRALRRLLSLLAWAIWPVIICLTIVPAVLCISCAAPAEEEFTTNILLEGRSITRSGTSDWQLISTLDVFTFDDSGIMALECYERIVSARTGGTVTVRSTGGRKRTVLLANCHLEEEDIRSVGRYDDLAALAVRYTMEDCMHPSMSAETVFMAGTSSPPLAVLKPFLSEIEVSSLEPGELEDIYVYILNAAESCPLLCGDESHPNGFLNHFRMKEQDLGKMSVPRILAHSLASPKAGTVLYCYPNTVSEESAGSPFTRLAIEGSTSKGTRLYSIEIGRPGDGVLRGKRYSYTISIGEESKPFIEVHPGNFIMGKTGEDLHIWCETNPSDTEVVISREDLEFDRDRGIYDYTMDSDGKGVTLHLTGSGTGMFCVDAGPPVNDGLLIVIVVDQDHIGI